jgi:hypothetical protein
MNPHRYSVDCCVGRKVRDLAESLPSKARLVEVLHLCSIRVTRTAFIVNHQTGAG